MIAPFVVLGLVILGVVVALVAVLDDRFWK
jgi:hypothetical protein